jgi:hypothetical protein
VTQKQNQKKKKNKKKLKRGMGTLAGKDEDDIKDNLTII